MSPIRLVLIAVAALLATAAPASAAIVTDADYRVDVEVAATYHHVAHPTYYDEDFTVAFTWSGSFPKVTFVRGGLKEEATGTVALSKVASKVHAVYHGPGGDVTGDCAGSSGTTIQAMTMQETLAPLTGGAGLVVRPFGAVSLPWTCTGVGAAAGSALVLPNPVETALAHGPFDLAFTMPDEAMSLGKVIQRVAADIPLAQCPLHAPSTETCTLHYEGLVTFTRTRLATGSDEPDDTTLEPLAPPKSTTPATDDASDLLEPLVPRKAKVRRDARSATVEVGCRAACTVTVQAFARAGAGSARSSARARALATRRVTLAAAGSSRVTLRFAAAARRAIKRARGVRLAVVAQPSGGGAAATGGVSLKL